jgi:FAD/FMN-containing dehydrogenase
MSDAVIAKLQALLGEKGFIPAEAVGDWKPSPLGPTHARQAACVVRPASADEAAAVLKLCHEAKQAVVVGGGFTGLVHATDTSETEILMSMERMTAIREIDPIGRTMIAEAGVPIQTVQEAAEREGLFYPVDWGARGSATVGGSLATNAGGNRVIRWGMTRDSVLGAEVALTDGTVLHNLNTLVKNNAGYDLKNLFVGSEGTLGVITAASLRLREKPQSHNAAFAAVPSFEALTAFLKHMDRALGGTLSAFEVMWREAYEVLTATPNTQPPLPQGSPFTVLTEAMGGHQQADKERFEAALEQALEDGLITDAAVAQSAREITAFWSVRDSVLNFGQHWPIFTFDVSLPIRTMKYYLSNLKPAQRHKAVRVRPSG